MKYTVVAMKKFISQYGDEMREVVADFKTDNGNHAKGKAREWAKGKEYDAIFIETFRDTDGQHAYLNPDGFGTKGKNWA